MNTLGDDHVCPAVFTAFTWTVWSPQLGDWYGGLMVVFSVVLVLSV
jgi:hypothetical protein